MLTLILQNIATLLSVPLGILMLCVADARHPFADERHRTAWWVVGTGFTILAVNLVVHEVGAVWAFLSGPGSPVWETYLHWMPVGNHSRAGLVLGLGVALLIAAAPHDRAQPRRRAAAVVAMLAGMAGGGLLGWLEGPVTGRGGAHYYSAAMLNVLEFAVLAFALGYGIAVGALGRVLVLVLCVYAAVLAVNVGFFSSAAWVDVPGMSTPSPRVMLAYSIAVKLVMLSLVAYRLVLARRGVVVPALFAVAAAPVRRRMSFFG